QDDFFGHVNNHWLAENPIPPSEGKWGSFYMLRDQAWDNMRHIYESLQDQPNPRPGSIEQQARDFYYTGMHVNDLQDAHLHHIREQLRAIDTIASLTDLSRLLGELHRQGSGAPWAVVVDADDKNSAVHIL